MAQDTPEEMMDDDLTIDGDIFNDFNEDLEATQVLEDERFYRYGRFFQAMIGLGTTTHAIVRQVHAHMCAEVEKAGGKIDEVYYASEAPNDFSLWRKPAPGMLLEGLKKFNADPARTPFVGDMQRDMEAAVAAGCPRILVRTGKGATLEAAGIPAHIAPVTMADDLYHAAQLIIAQYGA